MMYRRTTIYRTKRARQFRLSLVIWASGILALVLLATQVIGVRP